ncbi:MAG: hypothetical protein KBS41_05195, partial [Oscillospiraceae bacterium]|nr:hypothetical protein [Candidatus Equicaccousia limihippi]
YLSFSMPFFALSQYLCTASGRRKGILHLNLLARNRTSGGNFGENRRFLKEDVKDFSHPLIFAVGQTAACDNIMKLSAQTKNMVWRLL